MRIFPFQQFSLELILVPILIDEEGTIKEKDIVIWMNYRTDRAKQILEALTSKNYSEYPIHIYKDLDVTISGLAKFTKIKSRSFSIQATVFLVTSTALILGSRSYVFIFKITPNIQYISIKI